MCIRESDEKYFNDIIELKYFRTMSAFLGLLIKRKNTSEVGDRVLRLWRIRRREKIVCPGFVIIRY
jgi:hypothetical protein